jgi:molybdenum transport protein
VGEVHSVEAGLLWAQAGAHVLQLEKVNPDTLAARAHQLRRQGLAPVLAAAGGIHPGNAADYVAAGAALLVSSWPYSAAPRDVAVRFVAGGAAGR